jgi:hypothetical protein
MNIARVFPVFSAAFAVLYVVCMHFNIAAFIYYPRLGEWHLQPLGSDGPPMFFYGWLFNSFIGAASIAGLAALIPKSIAVKVWTGWTWVICLVAIAISFYLMRIFFVAATVVPSIE